MSAAPTQAYEDDGGLSSDTGDDNDNDNDSDDDEEEDSDEEFVDALDARLSTIASPGAGTKPLLALYTPPSEDLFAQVAPPVGTSQRHGQGQGQVSRPPFNLPELNILPARLRGETDKVKPTGKAIAPVLVEGDKTPTDVLEVWFCGCHSDVGGGAVTNDTIDSLANISLRWMVREAMTSLCDIKFDAHALKRTNIELDLAPSVPELGMDAVDALEPNSRSAEALPALVVA
ncbi:hypothetical protein CVT25_007872 [Psilocybe cyanescens]|uniref:T6SS Phospholipase effector Tle1-like catalytic domain-containing protein n=1 Tax=Psilocybe cyanescens TaxID=93625 RepID=A0A409XJG9_PSICY|nr:hypothetical protein CVT25_007872 [Psilocybe cyanescens]